mmetsp:Transcript_19521/g.45624  ORF Transcript_19521/g.45624 Transcript_19521/m.45624 type:complete len:194 (-) Transcript_19521:64-645(-)
MELSEETSRGLKFLGEETMPKAAFEAFLPLAFDLTLREAGEDGFAAPAFSSVDPASLKQALAALITLILEGAKLNVDGEELSSSLDDCGVPGDRCKAIAKLYNDRRESTRGLLGRTGFSLPHVVGAEWRLDFLVKSKHLDHINRPTFFVGFKTENPDGTTQLIDFTCDREQLQDLVTKLEDATKQVTRTVSKR